VEASGGERRGVEGSEGERRRVEGRAFVPPACNN
jgi:hypothetical protein